MFVLTQARAERRRLFVIFYGNTETAERSSRKVETLCSTPLTYSHGPHHVIIRAFKRVNCLGTACENV